MQPSGLDALIRSLVESFAAEITELAKRAVLAAIEESLNATTVLPERAPNDAPEQSPRLRHFELTPAPPGSSPSAAQIPLTLDHYERMAILRALSESNGGVLAAAKLLNQTKSTMYRKMKLLGIPSRQSGPQDSIPRDIPFRMTDEQVSLEGYERLAIERAIGEARGDKLAAAKLLGVGKSTLYRKLVEHGIG